MNNLSAPQSFRVINTETGEIVESSTPNWYYILSNDGKLLLSNIKTKNLKYVSAFHIASSAIGMKDSKEVEIYAGDVGIDKLGSLWLVRYHDCCYHLQDLGGNKSYQRAEPLGEYIAITGNIYQPEYRKYLEQLEAKLDE